MTELIFEYEYESAYTNDPYGEVAFTIIVNGKTMCRFYAQDAYEKEDCFIPVWDSGVYDCGRIIKKNFDKITKRKMDKYTVQYFDEQYEEFVKRAGNGG